MHPPKLKKLQHIYKHSFNLPFVILPVLVLQSYDHFNNKRQEEKSQKPVVVAFLHIGHPPDPDQRDEDEQGSGDDGAQEAEEAHDAECLKVFLGSHRYSGRCSHTDWNKSRRSPAKSLKFGAPPRVSFPALTGTQKVDCSDNGEK